MSISSISSSLLQGATGVSGLSSFAPANAPDNDGAASSTSKTQRDQFKSDITTLFSAIKSGDMTAAKTALAAVQKDKQSLYSPSSKPQSAAAAPANQDFQAIIDAVNKGDATSAQTAMSKLQSDMASVKGHGGHHHHHHHGGGAPAAAATDSTGTTASTGITANASAGLDADGDHDGD